MISAIVAMDDEQGIAVAGTPPYNIPWNIPSDRQYFRDKTAGSTVVIGSKTYETFSSPLPGRRNVVVSNALTSVRSGFELANDLFKFLDNTDDDVWIIGGGKLYESSLALCDQLLITHVIGNYGCSIFFPDFITSFTLYKRSEVMEQNGYHYYYATYIKTGE